MRIHGGNQWPMTSRVCVMDFGVATDRMSCLGCDVYEWLYPPSGEEFDNVCQLLAHGSGQSMQPLVPHIQTYSSDQHT